MKKIIITGGPHTGKTTLLEGLRSELPNVYFIDEPAELLIGEERNKTAENPGYEGIYPWNRYPEFAKLVMQKSIELEQAIPSDAEIAILDRSIVDNIGYARAYGWENLIPEVMRLARAANYSSALFCDFVGEYSQTAVRSESESQARLTHAYLLGAYKQVGVDVVHVPALPIKERLSLATDTVLRLREL